MAWIKEKLKLAGQWILFILQALLIWGILCFVIGIFHASNVGMADLIKIKTDLPQWVKIYFVAFIVVFFILEAVQYFFHKKIPSGKYLILGMIINFGILYYYTDFSMLKLIVNIFYIAYPFLTPTN